MRTASILSGVIAVASAAPAVVDKASSGPGPAIISPRNGTEDGNWHIGCDKGDKSDKAERENCYYYQGPIHARGEYTSSHSDYKSSSHSSSKYITSHTITSTSSYLKTTQYASAYTVTKSKYTPTYSKSTPYSSEPTPDASDDGDEVDWEGVIPPWWEGYTPVRRGEYKPPQYSSTLPEYEASSSSYPGHTSSSAYPVYTSSSSSIYPAYKSSSSSAYPTYKSYTAPHPAYESKSSHSEYLKTKPHGHEEYTSTYERRGFHLEPVPTPYNPPAYLPPVINSTPAYTAPYTPPAPYTTMYSPPTAPAYTLPGHSSSYSKNGSKTSSTTSTSTYIRPVTPTSPPICNFVETECIDCNESPELCTSCNFMFKCGEKQQCSFFGFRDTMTMCRERGELCAFPYSNDDDDDDEKPKPAYTPAPKPSSTPVPKPEYTSASNGTNYPHGSDGKKKAGKRKSN